MRGHFELVPPAPMSLGASSPAHGACRVTAPRSQKPGPDPKTQDPTQGPDTNRGLGTNTFQLLCGVPSKTDSGKPLRVSSLFSFQAVLIVLL